MSQESSFSLPLLEWCYVPAGRVKIEGVVCNVNAFWMAKYPITYAQYEAFVNDKGYSTRTYWTDAGWQWKGNTTEPRHWRDSEWHIPTHPVIGVSWYESYAFTRWLSAKTKLQITLATESQWQRAAQGDDGREYPWGNQFDETRCNSRESGMGKTTPVTQYPNGASPFGVWDMNGNVWEWCLSKFAYDYFFPEDNSVDGTAFRAERVARGIKVIGLVSSASVNVSAAIPI